MSPSLLEALPGKLDVKRHLPSIFYLTLMFDPKTIPGTEELCGHLQISGKHCVKFDHPPSKMKEESTFQSVKHDIMYMSICPWLFSAKAVDIDKRAWYWYGFVRYLLLYHSIKKIGAVSSINMFIIIFQLFNKINILFAIIDWYFTGDDSTPWNWYYSRLSSPNATGACCTWALWKVTIIAPSYANEQQRLERSWKSAQSRSYTQVKML